MLGLAGRVAFHGCHTQRHRLRVHSRQDHDGKLQPLDPVHGRQPHTAASAFLVLIQNRVRDAHALEQTLVIVLDHLGRACHDADFFGPSILEQFLEFFGQKLLLLLTGREVVMLWLRPG